MKFAKKLQLEENLDPTTILLLLGIIVTLLSLLLYCLKKRKRYQAILLLGNSNSGKTVIFTYLIYGKIVATYTSMKENVESYKTKKRHVQIVDIPGHERLRQSLIDQHKADMRGIMFVIDSKTIQSEIRDVAELLYGLLTDPVINSNCRQFLVICNKQDLLEAKGPAVIQMLLEKELNILRGLKTKQLDSTSDESDDRRNVYLGSRKKDFEFSQLKSMNVTFAESIASPEKGNESNMAEIVSWLSKC